MRLQCSGDGGGERACRGSERSEYVELLLRSRLDADA